MMVIQARLIVSSLDRSDVAAAGEPDENMAIDQALLHSVDDAEEAPAMTLRLYQWREPTLSLGYFQPHKDRVGHAPSRSLPCIRRASGGGAIVHHHELTYSLVVRDASITSQPGANLRLYRRTHACFTTALATFGAITHPFRRTSSSVAPCITPAANAPNPTPVCESFLCFRRRTEEDLILGGYKILGSAQRRARRTILQHGSLMIRASSYAPSLPGVANLGARVSSAQDLIEPLLQSFAQEFSIHWHRTPLSGEEKNAAEAIRQTRFGTDHWTQKR